MKIKAYIVIKSTLILLLPDSQTKLMNSEPFLPRVLMWNHPAFQESSFYWMCDMEIEGMSFNLICFPDCAGWMQQG